MSKFIKASTFDMFMLYNFENPIKMSPHHISFSPWPNLPQYGHTLCPCSHPIKFSPKMLTNTLDFWDKLTLTNTFSNFDKYTCSNM